MIVGFDNDDDTIFDAQREFLRRRASCTRWSACSPPSPRRRCTPGLPREGRLDLDDEPEFGTNVIPLKMSREELRDGYIGLMHDLYDAEAYFDRLENLFLTRRFDPGRVRNEYWRQHPWQKWRSQSLDGVRALGLFLRLMKNVPDPELRRIYRRRMTTMIRRRPDPNLLLVCVLKCALHYHHYTMSRAMVEQRMLVNTF